MFKLITIRLTRSLPGTSLCFAVMALIITSCDADRKSADKANSAEEKTLVVVSKHSLDEPMNYTRSLMLEKLIRTRAGMEPAFIEAGGKARVQAEQISAVLSSKPAILVVFPEETEPLTEALTTAVASGTKVIVIGRDLGPELCTTCLFVDDKKIGTRAGEFSVNALKSKSASEGRPQTVGRVVQLTGQEKFRSTRERSAGFMEALATEPGIQLVHDAPADWNAAATRARLEEALRLQKQFDVVFTHSDFIASTVNLALREKSIAERESVLVLGVDGQPGKGGGLQMITKAEIDATVFNPPLVDLAWKIIRRMLDDPAFKPKARYELEPFVVTSEKAFELSTKGVPSPEP